MASNQAASLVKGQNGGVTAAVLAARAAQRQVPQLREEQSFAMQRVAPIEEADSSDEDDVHQCGRCKDIFRNLQLYMQHKASKVCKNQNKNQAHIPKNPPAADPPPVSLPPINLPQVNQEPVHQLPAQNQSNNHQTNQPTTNILEEAAKDTIYKQLEILVVDEEPEERQSTVDVQSISNEQHSNGVTYVAVQNKDDQSKVNPPIIMMNKESANNKKQGGRGRPRKSQPSKLVSPTGEPTSAATTSETSPTYVSTEEAGAQVNRKRPKPAQIVSTDIVPLTAEDSTLPSGPEDEAVTKSRQNKMKRMPTSFPCSICKLEFVTKQLMLEHRGKHTKLFKCKVCSEGFYTEDKLNKHTEKETHNYPCEHCSKVLVSKASLQRHRVVHGEKNIICDVCNRAFKTARDMKNHKIGVHSEEKNFICECCGKGFARREKLRRHSLIHAPNRPVFTCPFKNHTGCDKVFYRKDKLTRHLYSHSKIKPFKCDHCMKTFARTDNLREHMRTHTGVFRYYCTICGKGQPGPKKYQQHMLKQHNIENFEVPNPLEDNAPVELIEQHRAIIMAETEARASRGSKSRKKSLEGMGDGDREREQPDFTASLHHTTMVTSYSTVSLRDIDPTASLAPTPHHLLHPGPAPDQPSTPTTVHPRPQADDNNMRVNEHDKHDYSVPEMMRNAVPDMGRNSVHEMPRGGVTELNHGSVSDMARNNVQEMNRNDEIARGQPQMVRGVPELNRNVQDIGRNVPDMGRGVQEMRMKVSELSRSIEMGRAPQEIPRSISDIARSVQEMPRRNPQEMQRGAEMGSNIMVPSSHAERPNIMVSTSHTDRPQIMVPASHAERGAIMVPTSHAERVGIHLLPQSVIQQNMHFTNLLNSDLASIGEAVVRNQSLPVMSSIFKSFHGQSMQ